MLQDYFFRGCKGGWMRMGPAQLKEDEDYVRLWGNV